ncbi:ubiquitin-associated protein 1 [Amia ocellicauda]|uniref:ubiquitin-associated protein 1 n=1 Tax=Amia ocellicauda TaxID=2972642 RepID=UPI0034639CD4
MASRKSGSDFHNTGPFSYLDDVPFKISDKFRSPAKVGLPIGFCLPDCSQLSELEYDFSLERRTVRWAEELAGVRKAQERARLKAEAAQAKGEGAGQERRLNGDLSPSGDDPASSPPPPLPPAMNPVLAGLRHNAILTPLPAPSLRQREPSPPAPHYLNLADFECEEDPFDKLELKTLNDKEELRSILQLQAVTPPEPKLPLNKPGLLHKPNGLVALLQLDGPGGPLSSSPPLGSQGPLAAFPCNIRSLSFPKLSESEEKPPPCEDHRSYSAVASLGPVTQGLPNGTHTSQRGSVKSRPEGQEDLPGPQSCPQVPADPHNHTHNGAPTQPNTHTGPPPAVNTASSGPSGPPAPASVPAGHCGPLMALSQSERQCLETIVAMGYPWEGVIKAMQKQGQNMEQVLDYLFVHGRLCERGFDPRLVEECLEMYQCSEEKALEFLQLMSRFREMGFERDAIKEVLLVHNNDQDKALEDLMSRATAS